MAGARATGLLADYGADVVWIEPPGGDPCRVHEPAAMSVFNRGKRSVELDLEAPAALDRLLQLADRADVFVESWAPGGADRLGVGFDVLHARNPGLVYVSISGFGEDGRDAGLPGLRSHRSGCRRGNVRPGGAPGRSDLPRLSLCDDRRRPSGGHGCPGCPAPARAGWSRPACLHLPGRRRPGLQLDDVGRD